MSVILGYLGPKGTFSEEAALKYAQQVEDKLELVEYPTIDQVVEALLNQEINQGIVPLENSLEGGVSITLDLLATSQGIIIQRELICPVVHYLVALPGVNLAGIKELYSHPQVFSQCREYLHRHLCHAEIIHWHSTAAAAEVASNSKDKAAIASKRAAHLFNLEILGADIQDGNGNVNQTRFVVLGREEQSATGEDKTSLVISIKDAPGSLYSILGAFAKRNINLTRIESRPARKNLGDYLFFIDLEGHRNENHISEALNELESHIVFKKMLGSYPKAAN